jgi:hypothetical protein
VGGVGTDVAVAALDQLLDVLEVGVDEAGPAGRFEGLAPTARLST